MLVVLVDEARLVGIAWIGGQCRLDVVDNLLRLELRARRHGASILLRQPDPDFVEFIELLGFADRLRVEGRSYSSMRGGRPNSGNSSG